jgi:hypothetical protein
VRFRFTRAIYLRAIGFIYVAAFVSLWWQLMPLFGRDGVLPVADYLERVRAAGGSMATTPTLFWLGASDGALRVAAAIGLALSIATLAGVSNAIVLAALWAIYMSFVHVGQIFYGYGWEILLLEAGFLAIFLAPLFSLRPKRDPPVIVIFLIRWLLFRVLFGAGMIKWRGDSCWRDLTCLVYHYETQPIPNPLSWLLHQAPPWFHALGALYNHFVELMVPFFLFWPKRIVRIAGLLEVVFQVILILSGNLSWLNWLTLALCIACFDDDFLRRLIPRRWRDRPLEHCSEGAVRVSLSLALLVAWLSWEPVMNLLSPGQAMNTSFDALNVVNTYGAFGSVGRTRNEVILEGSLDGESWREYELPCKPGDPARRPCVIAPLQPRLEWQIWFAAMSSIEYEPWLMRVIAKLLDGDPRVLSLFARDPFAGTPPRYLRAQLYEYHFTRFGEPGWWKRRLVGEYLPPVHKRDPLLDLPADDRGF